MSPEKRIKGDKRPLEIEGDKAVKKVKIFGVICLVLTSMSGYAVLCVRHFYASASHKFVLSSHSQISSLSADCKKRLQTFFAKQRALEQSPATFSAELKKQIPALKKITFSYKSQKKTLVMVQCARPLFVFNNQVAITDQKTQVAQNDFEQSVLAELPHFSVVQAEKSQPFPQECIQYARELDPGVHAFYDVEWVDSSLIKFHDKQHAQITVLGCAQTKAETILQSACREVTVALLERKPSRKGTKNDWCIDRRFKGQMIVFPGGRVTNEKAVCG